MAGPWEDFAPAKSGPWEEFKPSPLSTDGENFKAGIGRAFVNAKRGLEQIGTDIVTKVPGVALVMPESTKALALQRSAEVQADIDESRRLDAPLMDTKAGIAGDVVGNTALSALIPAASTVKGAAAIGGAVGAAQPVATGESRAFNAGVGAIAGAGAMKLGDLIRQYIAGKLANSAGAVATKQAQNAESDAVLNAARDAGYVLPPTQTNPSFSNARLEGVAGKAATKQQASLNNQDVTNALARRALGLADDAPLSAAQLEKLSGPHRAVYDEVAKLSPDAEEAVKLWRQANFDKNAYWKFFNRSADPAAQEKAVAASEASKQWFEFLTKEAKAAGRPDLVKQLAAARISLGKIGTVERALNDASGDVVAKNVKGGALTDELKLINQFANGPGAQFVTEGAKVPSPGVSKLEGALGSLLAIGGGATLGPAGVMAGALPMLSHPVRSMILSPTYQRLMANPDYSVPIALRASNAALQSPVLRALLPGAAAGGIVPQMQQ